MFLPVGSNLPFFRFPVVTASWMLLSAILYFCVTQGDLQYLSQTENASLVNTWTYNWAIVPSQANPIWNFISYQFIHGSWGHLISNMWYFLVLGWILENALGPVLFLAMTLMAGAIAVIPEFFVQTDGSVPIVGASGAVAFILGAVCLMFPKSKVRLLFLLIPLPNTPASFFVPVRYLVYFWLTLQISGLAMHVWVEPKPVAYATHLFGFFIGAVVGLAFNLLRRPNFIDIDLSGRDLKRFYESISAYKDKEIEKANELLARLSERNQWVPRLQQQFFTLALDMGQKDLAGKIFRNAMPAWITFGKADAQLSGSQEAYFRRFGESLELEKEHQILLSSRKSSL